MLEGVNKELVKRQKGVKQAKKVTKKDIENFLNLEDEAKL